MNKALVYVVGFLGAVFAAIILQVLAQDEFGISQGINCRRFPGVRWNTEPDMCGRGAKSAQVDRGKGSWHEIDRSPGF